MGVKIKHTDPTLNSFSTDDIIVNVSEGSLFFKSNTNLFKIKGDTISTTVTESFGNESWFRSGNNLYYTSGSVGIGTTSPDAKLEVAADGTTSQEIAHFGNSNGVGKIKLQIDGAGSSKQVMLDATNNEDIVLSTQGDSYFNISHGNVGVGTTSPGEKLEVVGNISSSGNLFATGLFFRNVTGEKAYIKQLNSGGNQIEIGSDNLVVFKETDADQEKVRFDLNSGNVGIGTDSPGEKLELGTGDKIKLTSNSSVSGSIVVLASDSEAILSTENDSATGDPLQFILKHDFGRTELINRRGNLILSSSDNIVSPTSKVGIGTTSPDEKLSVTGGNIELTVSGKIGFNVSDDITSYTAIQDDGTTATASDQVAHYGLSRTDTAIFDPVVLSGYYGLEFATQGTKRVRINQNGRVGIGTDSPSTILDVNGTITATGTSFSSDINLKTNINNIETPLETISKIKGVTFNWNDDIIKTDNNLQGKKYGFIAQEVEKIIPSLVHTNKNKSISYFEIIPLLVEAMKEQQNQINELKNKLNE